jgi:hypothetical protein
MSKTLILPDVHNRISVVEKIISTVRPDTTIFLGDFFDDFYDTPDIVIDVARWFKWSVNKKNRIHIQGNHDTHYWFNQNKNVRCSGYEYRKDVAINDVVTIKDWEKLKFFHILDGKFLLSHAGVHPFFIVNGNNKEFTLKQLESKLKKESKVAVKKMYSGGRHWLTSAGYSRNGSQQYGGITWCDWTQEFAPIKGIHQVVGHTPINEPNWSIMEDGSQYPKTLSVESMPVLSKDVLTDVNSYNICLDTHPGSKNYAIYENGTLTIHKSCDLK